MKKVEFLRIESLLESIGLKQIAVEPNPDSELGFRMWGGKDALGIVTRFLAKGKPGLLESLRISSLASAGAGVAMISPEGELYKSPFAPVQTEQSINCIYVSNTGDDENDGLSPATAVANFAYAITLAEAQFIATTKRCVVVCRDGSTFSQAPQTATYYLPEGVDCYAPLASFNNPVNVFSGGSLKCKSVSAGNNTAIALVGGGPWIDTLQIIEVEQVLSVHVDPAGTSGGIAKHNSNCNSIIRCGSIKVDKQVQESFSVFGLLSSSSDGLLFADVGSIQILNREDDLDPAQMYGVGNVGASLFNCSVGTVEVVTNTTNTRIGCAFLNAGGTPESVLNIEAKHVRAASGIWSPALGETNIEVVDFDLSTYLAIVAQTPSTVRIQALRLPAVPNSIHIDYAGELVISKAGAITVSDEDYTPSSLFDKLDSSGGVEHEIIQASQDNQRLRLNATAGASFRGEMRSTETGVLTSFGLNLAAATDISQSAILCHIRRIGVAESLVFTVEYQTIGALPRVTILANDANYSFTSFVTDGTYGWLSLETSVADADYLVSYSSLDLQQKDVVGYLDPNANGVIFTNELFFSSDPSKLVDLTAGGGGSSTSGTHYTFTPQNARPENAEGTIYFRNPLKSWVGVDAEGNEFEFGREEKQRCINIYANPIPEGTVVFVEGFDSGFPAVWKARSNVKSTCILIGVTTTPIPGNYGVGEVLFRGFARGLDTSMFNEGDLLYVSHTTAGEFTTVEPLYPNMSALVGRVGIVSATEGTILVMTDTDPVQSTSGVPGLVFKESTMTASVYIAGKGAFSNANGVQFGTSFYANAAWKPTRVRFRQSQGAISGNVRIGLYSEDGVLLAQSNLFTGSGDLVLSQTLASALTDDLIPGSLYHAVICSTSNGHLVYGASPGNLNANPRMGFQGQIVMNANSDCPADISSIIGSASPDRAWIEFF